MEFNLSLFETKVEFFEAASLKELERQIESQIENNKALLLELHSVSHQAVFNPRTEKMHYSAALHYRLKR